MDAADPEVKARQRAMWAAGDFPRVSRETVAGVGQVLVEAAGIGPGMRVLDVAAGSGNTSIPAALAGAEVIASDLTPELFEAGRAEAAAAGATLEWVEADAESLPFEDGSFDAVVSSFGAMFAPRHQVVADELLRVTRPGGTIAMANWTPEGWVGQFFVRHVPFMPPLPDGALPPIFWGVESHVRTLFGDGLADLTFARREAVVDRFATPEEVVEYYKSYFGPTILAYATIGDDAARRAELDAALLGLARESNQARDGEPARYAFEYAVVTGRRAG